MSGVAGETLYPAIDCMVRYGRCPTAVARGLRGISDS